MSQKVEKKQTSGALASSGSTIGTLAFLQTGHLLPATISGLWAIQPVREAITRLISGSIEIPEAWLRNRKLMIDEQGQAERQLIQKFSDEARKAVSANASLKARAETYALTTIEKNQATRESIARKTLEHLSEGDIPEDASVPSENFMRSFDSVAEKMSSDDLQDIMARILAGEIRKPGSVSRATLSVADILDKNIIKSMLFIKPYVIENSWVCSDSLDFHEFYIHSDLLSSVGITSEMGPRIYGFYEGGYAMHSYVQGALIIKTKNNEWPLKFQPQTQGFNLTRSGRELNALLPDGRNISIEEIAKNYRKNKFIGEVITGTVEREDGTWKFTQS